jgi:hypothetical protein
MKTPLTIFSCAAFLTAAASLATEPNKETRRWWAHIEAIANDGMEGRDTGSEGYKRAERYVAGKLDQLNLKPAGEHGYVQTVPLHVTRVRTDRSRIELVRANGAQPLEWLRQIAVTANAQMADSIDAPMVFAGSKNYAKEIDVKGKIIVQLNRPRMEKALPAVITGGPPAGSAGLLGIDSPESLEPPRWPVQYSVAMTIAGAPAATRNAGLPTIRFNPAFAEMLFEGSGHTYRELTELESQGKPVPSFPLAAGLRAKLEIESADVESDNLLAMLPATACSRCPDAALAKEYVVLSAHLDGYGFGEPWETDRIYNGAFDDAAMVATLLETAQRLKEKKIRLKRSLIFAVFTGEEKGLLGSRYFTQHLTTPRDEVVANVNLDQVRPLFPLKSLTTVALEESTLGETVKAVGARMGIRIQDDKEPWRNLIRRADNWNFMQIGVPAIGFVLTPEAGSSDEAIYKEWYAKRYHTPLDDLKQPWDPAAAAKFNDFFLEVTEALANADVRPQWRPGSEYAKGR